MLIDRSERLHIWVVCAPDAPPILIMRLSMQLE